MRTIGRHWPKSARGDYRADCSDCGAPFRRSQLRKNRAGHYLCESCDGGRDIVTLTEANARAAQSPPRVRSGDHAPASNQLEEA